MSDLSADLLPGDEDAILDQLNKAERTAKAAEIIKATLGHFAETGIVDHLSGFASGGIFNSGNAAARMPIMPLEPEEAVASGHRFDTLRYGYGLQVLKPSSIVKLLDV